MASSQSALPRDSGLLFRQELADTRAEAGTKVSWRSERKFLLLGLMFDIPGPGEGRGGEAPGDLWKYTTPALLAVGDLHFLETPIHVIICGVTYTLFPL